MIFSVRSFSYTPDASFSDEFLLHFWGYVYEEFLTLLMIIQWGVSLTLPTLVLVMRLSYTSEAMFMKNFSYTPRAMSSEELLLHSWW